MTPDDAAIQAALEGLAKEHADEFCLCGIPVSDHPDARVSVDPRCLAPLLREARDAALETLGESLDLPADIRWREAVTNADAAFVASLNRSRP